METPTIFKSKKELFEFLVTNQKTLIAQKKAITKHSDGTPFVSMVVSKAGNEPITDDVKSLKILAAINTTNFMDSHKDVHLPGIWTKSLKENKSIMHLQEHSMTFDKIIADGKDLKVSAQTYEWDELGYDYKGTTEALIFESTVKESRNKFMLNQYKQGNVKNHSVGMRYVKLILCVNDEEYSTEFEAWEKYYPEIANKAEADHSGYFWAVKEAKVIEGSAVPIGSNSATPTLDNNMKVEPVQATQKTEPSDDTQINEFKILIKQILS